MPPFLPCHRAPLILALLVATQASAQQTDQPMSALCHRPPGSDGGETPCVLEATRLLEEGLRVVLDGRIDEPAWGLAVPAAGFVQREPEPGRPASQATEARVLYDGTYLYVGMRMFDSAADSIRAEFVRRDDAGAASDWAHVLLDTYYDRRTAFHFATTPTGARVDILHLEDTLEDPTWDAVWDVATSVGAQGWSAEFRIPLSQLRYAGGENMVWGVNFMRQIARRSETSYWVDTPPDAGRVVSLFADLEGLEGVGAPRRLEVLPYSSGGLRREKVDASDPFRDGSDWRASSGLDLKYGLTSNLTLTATVNPDFGQVEADPSVVNLGTFETFFPEKRPFFTEGAEIFRFPLVPEGHAFYSRRVGRPPQLGVSAPDGGFLDAPEATSIFGALKLSGKTASGWSVGLLSALTDQEEAHLEADDGTRSLAGIEPRTRYSVGRVQRDFRQGGSGLGLLATAVNREMNDPTFERLPSSAYTGGFNGWHRFGGGAFQARGWILGSKLRGSADAIDRRQRSLVHLFQRPDAEHLTYDPTRTSMAGAAGEFFLEKIGGGHWTGSVGGGFRSPGVDTNDAGFLSYTDIWYLSLISRYSEFQPRSVFRTWYVEGQAVSARTFGGEVGRPSLHLRTRGQFLNFWSATMNAEHWFSHRWAWELRGGPMLRRQPYTNVTGSVVSDTRKSWLLQLRGRWFQEDGIDSRAFTFNPQLDLRPTSRATVSLAPSVTWNKNPDQYVGSSSRSDGEGTEYVLGQIDQTEVDLTLRLSYAFTPELTFDFYGQPFVSSGRYSRFVRVLDPSARSFEERLGLLDPTTLSREGGRYYVDEGGDGSPEYSFRDRDFNVRELRTNAVLRWEYKPGSILYLVWSQAREDELVTGALDLGGDLDRLFGAPSQNVFLLKLSYWLGF